MSWFITSPPRGQSSTPLIITTVIRMLGALDAEVEQVLNGTSCKNIIHSQNYRAPAIAVSSGRDGKRQTDSSQTECQKWTSPNDHARDARAANASTRSVLVNSFAHQEAAPVPQTSPHEQQPTLTMRRSGGENSSWRKTPIGRLLKNRESASSLSSFRRRITGRKPMPRPSSKGLLVLRLRLILG